MVLVVAVRWELGVGGLGVVVVGFAVLGGSWGWIGMG